ncbi:hypothetical protein HPB52_024102 [Rhipicephalus sanguineus]|uniref:Uncharacterized protein n=1 Tax=Rhipicephalus sanguineus TaxID=34632 RepID=A0A9D4SV95_RHISA|nr:hypothetical protein HPB52_024102 [Rhipicephalus sanguineus]
MLWKVVVWSGFVQVHQLVENLSVFGENRSSNTLEHDARSLLAREQQIHTAVLNNNVDNHDLNQYRDDFEQFFHDTVHLTVFTLNHAYRSARLNRAITRLSFFNKFLDTIEDLYIPNGLSWNAALLNEARVEAVKSIEQVNAQILLQ